MNKKFASLALIAALSLCSCSGSDTSEPISSLGEESVITESSIDDSAEDISSSEITFEEWPDEWKDLMDSYTQGHSPAYYDPGIEMFLYSQDYSDYDGYEYDYLLYYGSQNMDATYDMIDEYADILMQFGYYDYSYYYGVEGSYYVLEETYDDGVTIQAQLIMYDDDDNIITEGYGYLDVYFIVVLPAEVYSEWPSDEINSIMSSGMGISDANIPAPSDLGSGVSIYDYAESYGVVEIEVNVSSDISSSYAATLEEAGFTAYFTTIYEYGIWFEPGLERYALYFGYDSDSSVFYIDIYLADTFVFDSDLIASYFYSYFGTLPSDSIPDPTDIASSAKYVDYYTGYITYYGYAILGIYIEEDIVDNYVSYLVENGWTNDNGECTSPNGDYLIKADYYNTYGYTWIEIHYLNA